MDCCEQPQDDLLQQRARDLVEGGRAERGRSLLNAEQYRRCNSTHHVAAGWANGRPLVQPLGGQPYPARGGYITNGSTPIGSPVQFLGCGTRLNQQTRRRRQSVSEENLISVWWYENLGGNLVEPAGIGDLFIYNLEPHYQMAGLDRIPPPLICGLQCNTPALLAAQNAYAGAGLNTGTEGCFLFASTETRPVVQWLSFDVPVCEYGTGGAATPGARYAGLTMARVYRRGGQLKLRGQLNKPAGTPTAQIRLVVFRLGAAATVATAGSIEGLRNLILDSYLANDSPDAALAAALSNQPLTRFWWLNNLIEGAWHGKANVFEAIGLEPYRLIGFDTNTGSGNYEFEVTEFDLPPTGSPLDRMSVLLNGNPITPNRYVYYNPAGDGMVGAGGIFNPLLEIPSGSWLVVGFVQAYEETGAIALDIQLEVGIE